MHILKDQASSPWIIMPLISFTFIYIRYHSNLYLRTFPDKINITKRHLNLLYLAKLE